MRSDGTPPQMAQAPTEISTSQCSRKCSSVSMFSSLATPPSTKPTAQRPVIRLMSVSEERTIVTRSSSGTIRSSMSRIDRVQPQQPHSEMVDTRILPARAATVAASGRRSQAARGRRGARRSRLLRVLVRSRAEHPLPQRHAVVVPPPIGSSYPTSLCKIAPTGQMSTASSTWSAGIASASSTSISMRAPPPRPVSEKIFAPGGRGRGRTRRSGGTGCTGPAPARSLRARVLRLALRGSGRGTRRPSMSTS